MSTTTHTAAAPAAVTGTAGPGRRPLLRAGLAATAVAAVATTATAAAGQAAGISLDMAGEPIPVSGFAVLTVLFSLVGVALAAVLARTARRPRRVFVRATGVLLVLSFVPDALADAAPATKALLVLTHLVAAAIVVPTLARRLR